MSEVSLGPSPEFLSALASVPAVAWARWFGAPDGSAYASLDGHHVLLAAFVLPGSDGQSAICVFGSDRAAGLGSLRQAVLKRWPGDPPAAAQLLHREQDSAGITRWSLASAWADADLRRWLGDALSGGATLRSAGWEWLATPERLAVSREAQGGSRQLDGRRHDVVLLPPGAVAVVYRCLTRGGQPELDLLRHLERVPGLHLAPTVLGSALIRSPTGERSASAILEELDPAASTVRAVLLGRLRRAFAGDAARLATSLEDVRAVGTITRELHASLGRPFGQGVLAGAVAATPADVEMWVARSWSAMMRATVAHRSAVTADAPALASALALLPAKLQSFGAAATRAPGLVHRIHGNLRLDTILVTPPRQLSVVEFDGDPLLGDGERRAPQSPWRDVAHVLLSLADVAAEAAQMLGDDPAAVERARVWEREARKALLEGYGSGGGALHALLAIFELEMASLQLIAALAADGAGLAVASHTLQRLSRTAG